MGTADLDGSSMHIRRSKMGRSVAGPLTLFLVHHDLYPLFFSHILPPRLALKIRSFFTSQIRQATDSLQDSSLSPSSTKCCGGDVYQDKQEWTKDDFTKHGPFELPYHPYDPITLTKEITSNAIDTIWVLPYAHKADISIKLNSAMVEVCTSLEQKENQLKKAINAFTVHPDDGLKIVKETTLQALIQGNAKVAKLHCSVGRYSVLNENLTSFWNLANIVFFPVVVHFGSSESGNTASQELLDIEELLVKYPQVRLIIAHSGHPAVVRGIKLAMQFEHVYLDTTPVVTVVPNYPPHSHPLHADLIQLAKRGKVLFGSDMPNVAISLANQIQAVFNTFADDDWIRPTQDKWWTRKREAEKAGKAVEQVLYAAAHSLIRNVDVSKAQHSDNSNSNTINSKM